MKAQIVSFQCILKDKSGRVISSTYNREVITHIHKPGRILKGLAEQLQHLKAGEKRTVFLSAEQAYGLYDPALVRRVPRKSLTHGDELQVGYQVLSRQKDGSKKAYRVTQLDRRWVTLDGNHPLAGQDLIFEIDTVETRDATSDEIAASCLEKSGPYLH